MPRVERGWGDLMPKIAREYYEKLDYQVTMTDVQIDQEFKIQ